MNSFEEYTLPVIFLFPSKMVISCQNKAKYIVNVLLDTTH